MEGALALAAADELLLPVHLPLHIRVCAARNRVTGRSGGRDEAVPERLSPVADLPDFREYRDSREADYLRALVERHGGDIGRMLKVSGLSRSRLYALLKKHGLAPLRA